MKRKKTEPRVPKDIMQFYSKERKEIQQFSAQKILDEILKENRKIRIIIVRKCDSKK